MGLFMAIIFFIAFPFAAIYSCYIQSQQKKEQEERVRQRRYEEHQRKLRIEQQELERNRREQMEIATFHNLVFPMESASQDIQKLWSKYPMTLHNDLGKYASQKRALYNTLPILIDAHSYSGLFLPSGAYTNSFFSSEPYRATLNSCTCPSCEKYGSPCKHMYRLFYELNHPDGNPGIIDVDPLLETGLSSLSESARRSFLLDAFWRRLTARCELVTPDIQEQIDAGLLVESSALPYEQLLSKMTKDQIILSLAKSSVQGYRPSWSKVKLITWVIETQPKFLKKQFKKYSVVSLNPVLETWSYGLYKTRCSYFISEQNFYDNFSVYS